MVSLIKLLLETEERKKILIKKTRMGELYSKGGRIIKITRDWVEYTNATKLIEFPSKYFVKYYSAKIIDDDRYELEMERLYDCIDSEYEIIGLILNSLGTMTYMLDRNRREKYISELKTHPEYYEDFGSFKDVLKILNNLYHIYEDANQRDMEIYDMILDNIMKNSKGIIVHVDVGG